VCGFFFYFKCFDNYVSVNADGGDLLREPAVLGAPLGVVVCDVFRRWGWNRFRRKRLRPALSTARETRE
jgi:hypothetical protein